MNVSVQRIIWLCDNIPGLIKLLPEGDFNRSPAPGKWSPKQILGHLIDSACNNHQRFVRTQFEPVPFIKYDQDNWNEASHYDRMPASHVISFWENYNRHLAELITHIPEQELKKECNTGDEMHSLGWIIADYVTHVEYHLRQIVSYDEPNALGGQN